LAYAPASARVADRLVIAHYFPPFPITIPDGPGAGDYYDHNYLRAEGEGGKFAQSGGFLRQRPLLPTPAPTSEAQAAALEIARAARIGIDAFGADLLSLEGPLWARTQALLDAASACQCGFAIAPEPDMTALGAITPQRLAQVLLAWGRHPSALRLADHRLLVLPFAAEARPPAFWAELSALMAQSGEPIALVPDMVDTKTLASLVPYAHWAAVWGTRDAQAGAAQTDLARLAAQNHLFGWLATLAPQDMRPKDRAYTEAEGPAALASAFAAAMAGRASALHLVTWNDYSEGSEIAPSSATRHAYYDLAGWYAAWFKLGHQPAILRDGFVAFHRRQIFAPQNMVRGAPWRNMGGRPLAHGVGLALWLRAVTSVELHQGANVTTRAVPAGFHVLTLPALGPTPRIILRRGTKTLADCTSPHTMQNAPSRHDPLYAGFSSLRGCQ
jgi:hypothetical protein